MAKAASALDYRALARRRLPHFLFEYIDGGSYGEVTLRRNLTDLETVTLRQPLLIEAEMRAATALTGRTRIGAITRDALVGSTPPR